MKKGEKLFIVDLESVSIFSQKRLDEILFNEEEYKKTPFLYLISSYSRNRALEFADDNLNYIGKTKAGSWMIYSFEK